MNFDLPRNIILASDTDVATALAEELSQLRDLLDTRTRQCLDYRALSVEMDEAWKEAEARIAELEEELAEKAETTPTGCKYCGATF